ncbi:hypothetical protein GH741_05050 [Aquibacillus halophilus]|uniref:DUF2564 family protein n=1 Tax=Aquibacillus halophilus TaxID=930132 RepID=A0A6A8DLA8_9BACI|nr:hypothetical protein [Aquibacillus halophilus]MRH42042.1 hypothetical protein [Aquibacillus halophilus]
MKHNNISSFKEQSQLAQAQQSIMHLQNTITQAKSHPNKQVLEQIKNSLETAERSLSQAAVVTDNQEALALARRNLDQQKQAIQEVTSGQLD